MLNLLDIVKIIRKVIVDQLFYNQSFSANGTGNMAYTKTSERIYQIRNFQIKNYKRCDRSNGDQLYLYQYTTTQLTSVTIKSHL